MRVLIALPTGNTVHWKLVQKVTELCKDKRYDVDVYVSKVVGTEANQNTILQHFLEDDYDYLLLIEIDQFPLSNPLDMIGHDKDIVSMPTLLKMPRWDGELVWSVFDHRGDSFEPRTMRGKGLEKVFAVNMGCVMIKRDVLESLDSPFTPVRDEDDNVLTTSDILFCQRAGHEGFEVWVDWDNCCSHFKEVDLLEL